MGVSQTQKVRNWMAIREVSVTMTVYSTIAVPWYRSPARPYNVSAPVTVLITIKGRPAPVCTRLKASGAWTFESSK